MSGPLRSLEVLRDSVQAAELTAERVYNVRRWLITEARDTGATLDQIADAAGLTRQRVSQILKRTGGDTQT